MKRIAHHTVHDSLKYITFEAANTYEQVKGDMFSLVQKAPVVDAVEVVHGKWESCWEDWRHQLEGNKCSVCGFEYFGNLFKYCPNCGAKMDGGAEGCTN
jgi:hypothetical protein